MKELWAIEDEDYLFDTRQEALEYCRAAWAKEREDEEELPVFEITHYIETDQPLVATAASVELEEAILELLTNGAPLSGQILPEIFREDRLDDLGNRVRLFVAKLLQGSNAWKQEVETYDPAGYCK